MPVSPHAIPAFPNSVVDILLAAGSSAPSVGSSSPAASLLDRVLRRNEVSFPLLVVSPPFVFSSVTTLVLPGPGRRCPRTMNSLSRAHVGNSSCVHSHGLLSAAASSAAFATPTTAIGLYVLCGGLWWPVVACGGLTSFKRSRKSRPVPMCMLPSTVGCLLLRILRSARDAKRGFSDDEEKSRNRGWRKPEPGKHRQEQKPRHVKAFDGRP